MPFSVRYTGPEDSVDANTRSAGPRTFPKDAVVGVQSGLEGRALLELPGFERVLPNDPKFSELVTAHSLVVPTSITP
jgi:hypothetical protein